LKDLSINIGELKLKNPVVAGGGPLAGTEKHIKDCVDAGFGAIVTKTTSTPWFLKRYPRPRYQLVDYRKDSTDPYYVPDQYTWMHREHNSAYPPLGFAKMIAAAAPYAKEKNCKIIGSFAARTPEEWEEIARAYQDAGCDALEINFCCPFPPEGLSKDPAEAHVGVYFTKNPDKGADIIKHLKQFIHIPMYIKLSPDGGEFGKIGAAFAKAGADGLTLVANNKILRIDIETGKPLLFGATAGTGPWAKPFTLRYLAELFTQTGLPLMGSRGASSWQDAIEFIMAGAAGVQYCTPVMLRGLGYVNELLRGIEGYMERKRIDSLEPLIGSGAKLSYSNRELIDNVKPLVANMDYEKCIGCGRCGQVCWYDAIKVHKKAVIKQSNCAGCSMCGQVCPVNAISMSERDNDRDHFAAMISAHPDLAEPNFLEVPKF
jgi:dihydroorotate dehydrogenase/NAD-dependent dihydropyrimidine dehydrogenase PreA subunit